MYQKIEFTSRALISFKEPEPDAIVISIANSTMSNAFVKNGFKDVLFLKFDSNSNSSKTEKRFNQTQAEQILSFVRQHEQDAQTIYVNCIYGESRSAAVAQYLANYYKIEIKQKTNLKSIWVFNMLEKEGRKSVVKKR